MRTQSKRKKISPFEKTKALNKPVISSSASSDLNSCDALDGCSSISEWEDRKGRGFWGCSSNGYIYDKDL